MDMSRKFYCIRNLQESVPYNTTMGLNCEVTFTADKNIVVCGIEVSRLEKFAKKI